MLSVSSGITLSVYLTHKLLKLLVCASLSLLSFMHLSELCYLCLNGWHLFWSLMTHLCFQTCSQSRYFACRFSLLMSPPSFDHANVIFTFFYLSHSAPTFCMHLFMPPAFYLFLAFLLFSFSFPSVCHSLLLFLPTSPLFHLSSALTRDSSLVSCMLILS